MVGLFAASLTSSKNQDRPHNQQIFVYLNKLNVILLTLCPCFGGRLWLDIQGDQLNIVVFFYHSVKSDLFSVRYRSYAHWTSYFLQGTRKTRPCSTGHPVVTLLRHSVHCIYFVLNLMIRCAITHTDGYFVNKWIYLVHIHCTIPGDWELVRYKWARVFNL